MAAGRGSHVDVGWRTRVACLLDALGWIGAEMGMRVVFLDFDGVLHPAGVPAGSALPFEWISELAHLLAEHPHVGVVVHSSWRSVFSPDELREFLRPLGWRPLATVGDGAKAIAIQNYLREHPEIEDFIILDDDAQEFPAKLGAHLVACASITGVSEQRVKHSIVVWLDGPGKVQ
ncbi:HAD domain-containing protein [Variovorax dokdonensis]|uniref:HAD domain-containing protein n=1 Tax=Variovorax dokdonensis TaxID=344883 RepID=A0ABT7NFR6_9BURK|nr:HAD domain-containing protein [Variovorax dokdonensis]MDM0046798.1 HAD domain-containing protein [Variovorax dokdonensis]